MRPLYDLPSNGEIILGVLGDICLNPVGIVCLAVLLATGLCRLIYARRFGGLEPKADCRTGIVMALAGIAFAIQMLIQGRH